MAWPLVPDCQLFTVSTSSHHGYPPAPLGTRTGGDCALMAEAAATSQEASWLPLLSPYCHAHAGEFWPTVKVPDVVVTVVVVHVPYGVDPAAGQSAIGVPL